MAPRGVRSSCASPARKSRVRAAMRLQVRGSTRRRNAGTQGDAGLRLAAAHARGAASARYVALPRDVPRQSHWPMLVTSRTARLLLVAALLTTAGCGGDAPTSPQGPPVAPPTGNTPFTVPE